MNILLIFLKIFFFKKFVKTAKKQPKTAIFHSDSAFFELFFCPILPNFAQFLASFLPMVLVFYLKYKYLKIKRVYNI